MPRAKRTIQGAVTINGFALVWRLHREEQLETSDGAKGLAIHVSVAEGDRRELHLEYPVRKRRSKGTMIAEPARPTIVAAKVEADIREAMEAGWDPGSRGKPFVCQMAELPS